jgi:hypothetical protein
MIVQACERVLKPCPIALAGGDPACRTEAVERIIGEDVWYERLVPHGVGNYDIVRAHLAFICAELWIDHRIATGDFDLHVVDDAVHLRNGVAFGLKQEPTRGALGATCL